VRDCGRPATIPAAVKKAAPVARELFTPCDPESFLSFIRTQARGHFESFRTLEVLARRQGRKSGHNGAAGAGFSAKRFRLAFCGRAARKKPMILQETTYAPPGATATQTRMRSGGQPQNEGVRPRSVESALDNSAKALGWFSLALGTAEFLFPRRLAHAIGAPPKPITMRLMGLREVAVGVGILAAERKAGWIKARVAGDAIDLAMLKSSFDSRRGNRIRLACTVAGVAAVTAADVIYARKFAARESSGTGRIRVEASMAVNKPAAECYEFWREAGNFPKFMKNVEAAQTNGDRTHLKVREGLATFEWDAEITEEIPNEAISWRSVNSAKLPNSGSVRFEPRLGARGATVRLAMEFDSPAAGLRGMADGFLKTIARHRVRENLRRFKSVIECGEFPVTKGQPSGRRTCASQKEATR
jgi:uncharacterized membrane protein